MAIEEILKIVNKFVPDKTDQGQIELELRKLEIEALKEKGNYLEKINKCIPFVLPGFLLALLGMFILTFLSDFIFGILGKEAPIIPINEYLVEFCKWFITLLFGKKTIEKFSDKK